jgi:hypothetical protein
LGAVENVFTIPSIFRFMEQHGYASGELVNAHGGKQAPGLWNLGEDTDPVWSVGSSLSSLSAMAVAGQEKHLQPGSEIQKLVQETL